MIKYGLSILNINASDFIPTYIAVMVYSSLSKLSRYLWLAEHFHVCVEL